MRAFSTGFLLFFLAFSACKPDLCEGSACENGGTCNPETGACECLEGFRGASCEIFDLGRYLGSYQAAYQGCVQTAPDHRVILEAVPGRADRLRLLYLGDYACPGDTLAVEAQVSTTQINLPSQQVDCGDIVYLFEGSGSFSGPQVITLAFTVSYDAGGVPRSDACQVSLSR
jgi:hypothetical protein